jgi:U32 family peptidase
MSEKEIGKVTHFFEKPSVAVIELTNNLKVGDEIHVKGNTSDFVQTIDSMQIEHESVKEAKKGEVIGLKVIERVRANDVVYLVE